MPIWGGSCPPLGIRQPTHSMPTAPNALNVHYTQCRLHSMQPMHAMPTALNADTGLFLHSTRHTALLLHSMHTLHFFCTQRSHCTFNALNAHCTPYALNAHTALFMLATHTLHSYCTHNLICPCTRCPLQLTHRAFIQTFTPPPATCCLPLMAAGASLTEGTCARCPPIAFTTTRTSQL
eukprot:scaffold91804_cov22-Tisochrysis_lutea.AAC.1